MKLYTLGTSHGVPTAERYCNCNLLETGGKYYLVDAGAPAIELIMRKGLDPTKVRALFITHPHSDHFAGMYSLITLYSWYFKDTELDIYVPESCLMDWLVKYSERDGDRSGFAEKRLRVHVYGDGEIYRDENVTFTAYPSGHCENAHSLWVETEGKSALFTGDLDWEYKTLCPRAFTDRTAFTLIECAHQSREAVLATFPRIKTDRLLVTHVGLVITPPMLEEMIALGEINATVVNDGDVFEA